MESGSNADFTGVWTAGDGRGFVVGERGTNRGLEGVVLTLNGETWTPVFRETDLRPRAVWGSAHGDAQEVLRWLRGFKAPPKETFLVHGEPAAMDALQQKIAKELGWKTRMPQWQERIDLE